MLSAEKPFRLLFELRPAADGFSGIPQETRLLYAMLTAQDGLETTGLLNSHNGVLAKPRRVHGRAVQKDTLFQEAKTILQLADLPRVQSKSRILRILQRAAAESDQVAHVATLKLANLFDVAIKTYPLNTEPFFDFVWTTYLAASLPASEREALSQNKFAIIRPGWNFMHRAAPRPLMPPKYMRMNAQDFDILLAQTPWPARLDRQTRLVVRYHDAIPVYYPHTIQNPYWHLFTHYHSLKSNLRDGARFVCNSENSRSELLGMFPEREAQTHVIPCVVSDEFTRTPTIAERTSDIVRASIEKTTEPEFGSAVERERFYDEHLLKADFRYLLVVSTLEPRKNHKRLIPAWRMLRAELDDDLKLVLVGRPGWGSDSTTEIMHGHQARGQLFNLSGVPASSLRTLYANAAAVVCPSIAEGFDLSGVEAMLSGGVVAASEIPVHREIYGNACVYFDPYSPRAAADTIGKLIAPEAESLRGKLRRTGAKTGAKYLRSAVAPQWERFFETEAPGQA